MKRQSALSSLLILFCLGPISAQAQSENLLDELDPSRPDIEQVLEQMDRAYEFESGRSAHLDTILSLGLITPVQETCVRQGCTVWAQVIRSKQKMNLWVNGDLVSSWPVSTGAQGYSTPNFDKHPDGRIYDRYTSQTYPGGDYQKLGNMPYAVFIKGGYAIHGTGTSNWKRLGQRASHGCIRLHPDNAKIFNRLVRSAGIAQTWITVEENETARLASR